MSHISPHIDPTQSTVQDDEIDIRELFYTLWQNKRLIFLVTLISIIIAGIISVFSPKQYKSTASFFISNSQSSSSALMGYASMFGIDTPSNIENLIQNVLESYSIKRAVAEIFRERFSHEISDYIREKDTAVSEDEIVAFLIHESLFLEKRFSFNVTKNNLFKLTFISTDPELSKHVLDVYIDLIIDYNQRLELSVEKNMITIVDPPRIPLKKFKPNTLLNLIFGSILGLSLSSIFVEIGRAHV